MSTIQRLPADNRGKTNNLVNELDGFQSCLTHRLLCRVDAATLTLDDSVSVVGGCDVCADVVQAVVHAGTFTVLLQTLESDSV